MPITRRMPSQPRTSATAAGPLNVMRTMAARFDAPVRWEISTSVIVPASEVPLTITVLALAPTVVSLALIVAGESGNVHRANVLPVQAQSSCTSGAGGWVRQNASMPACVDRSGAGSTPS